VEPWAHGPFGWSRLSTSTHARRRPAADDGSMSTQLAGPAPAPGQIRRAATPAQLAWLKQEVAAWQAAGLLHDGQAAALLSGYHATRRFSLGRLLLALGGTFVGVGLIWLVAANLGQLPPLTRFGAVLAIWLTVSLAAHLGAERRRTQGHTTTSPLVETGRLLSVLAFGAVVFQAAQSLQVPAYEPHLVGVWSLGAVAYAYAVRGLAPLVVGVGAGVVWLVWQSLDAAPSALGFVVVLLAAAAGASAIAILHARSGPRSFEPVWRESGALLMLVALFAAAVPDLTREDFTRTTTLTVTVVLALALVAAAVALGHGRARMEPLAVVAVALVAVGLVLWGPSDAARTGAGAVPASDWAQATLSVAAYVAVATWLAVLGIWRDSGRLTWLALGSLVVFTVFQSFAVFARIIDGAWLFVVLGLVLFGAGYGFDRARPARSVER